MRSKFIMFPFVQQENFFNPHAVSILKKNLYQRQDTKQENATAEFDKKAKDRLILST